jgi:hypothetical protein
MGSRRDSPAGDGPASAGSTYGSGERVFGPPRGTFDVEWVAREIDRGTGAGYPAAHDWVATAWDHARRTASVHEDGIRAALLASGAPTAAADLVARHVVAYCEAYDVDPAG